MENVNIVQKITNYTENKQDRDEMVACFPYKYLVKAKLFRLLDSDQVLFQGNPSRKGPVSKGGVNEIKRIS